MQKRFGNKQIWLIAYPILVSLLMEQLIGMTDTAFLGRVGEIELGAAAIGGVLYIVMFIVGMGFGIGTQILMARRNGEERYREIGNLFYQGIYFQVGLASVLVLLYYCLAPLILKPLVSSEHIYSAAVEYLNWRVLGFFFSFTREIFRAFFLGTTKTGTLTLNSVVMLLSNVAFNYVLIFGKLGFPALGITGAAIGSTLAGFVSLLFFIVYMRRKVDTRKYGLNTVSGFRIPVLRQMLNVSLWTMIQHFISLSTWFVLFIYVEHLGERPIAVSNIIRNIYTIPFMVTTALSSSCSALVSNIIGAGNADEVPRLVLQHIRLAGAIVLPMIILFALFPEALLRIYTNIPDLRTAAVPSLWVICACFIFIVPSNICFNAVSGTGNTRTAFVMELAMSVLYLAYTTVVVAWLKMDVAVAWTSEAVYSIGIGSLALIYLWRGTWKNRKI